MANDPRNTDNSVVIDCVGVGFALGWAEEGKGGNGTTVIE